MRVTQKISVLPLLAGIILIVINFAGFFLPLRNPDIYHEKNTGFKEDIVITKDKLLEILKKEYQSDEEFVIKINEAINKGIAHYWDGDGIDRYNLRVPIYENFILFLSSYIYPSSYKKYEFCDYRKALERGVGVCSQQAIIVSEIMNDYGIDSKIVVLSGHVVAMAEVDSKNNIWWTVDPDYGVVIKHDIRRIEESPEIIKPYYVKAGYGAHTVNRLIKIYGSEGNSVKNGASEYCSIHKRLYEKLSYFGIWMIPLFLISPSLILLIAKKAGIVQSAKAENIKNRHSALP